MNTLKAVAFLKKTPGYIFKIFMAVLVLVPVIWIFFSAFRPRSQMLIYPPNFIPSSFSWENFDEVMRLLPIGTYFLNTVVFTVTVSAVSLLLNSMAGYAFARMQFRGKNLIFTFLMMSMMIPFHVIMIPLFMQIYFMGMLDTMAGLVIPRFAGVGGVFFMRAFFSTLPKQLEEAARVDGLSEFGIYFRIMMPLCKPAVITQTVLAFNGNWNDLLWPLLIINSPERRMMTNGISFFIGQDANQYGPAFAAGVISVIPLIIIFIFAQKYFVSSLVSSGIKG